MRNLRRKMALLLVGIMIIISFGSQGLPDVSGETIVHAQETDSVASATDAEGNTEDGDNSGVYTGENYRVEFVIDNRWASGYNATISIYNTGDTKIENWTVAFPLNESIDTIWNAEIAESYDDYYVIKNAGWNQDIPVGGSISFGITSYEAFGTYPSYYTLLGNEIEIKSGDYSVQYEIVEDWGAGYKARVIITNNRSTVLEDWRLQFDYGDNIANIWDAVILMRENEHYIIGGDTYSQNIPAKESITFEFLVEPGTSETGFGNILLSEYKAYNSDRYLSLIGFIQEDSNELELFMESSQECYRYEFFGSIDGGEYTKIGEAGAVENYTYMLQGNFSRMEVYAVGYYEEELKLESTDVIIDLVDGHYAVSMPDTDGDGVEDCFELYFGTDIQLVDTDGDGLSDFYELKISGTSPTEEDTDHNGVFDGDEDYDQDGLTTLEECELGTDPCDPDMDGDNLTDGDEVKLYKTKPTDEDTDGDGLEDGDEIYLGTDPLIPDTDGNGILDGDELFFQTYTHEVKNEECVISEILIELEGTGNLQTNTYVESVMDVDVLCTNVVGLVGEPFEIETKSRFEQARLTFQLDKEKLTEEEFSDLMFLWFDEDNQRFVELNTILDSEAYTASVDTTHFSKYMLVNKTEWYKAWAEEINYNQNETATKYNTVLAIDCSESMSSNDPITLNNNVSSGYDAQHRKNCNRINAARAVINQMGRDDKIAIVLFNSRAWVVMELSSDKSDLILALQQIKNDGNTSLNAAMSKSISLFDKETLADEEACNRIILLTDGQSSYSDTYLQNALDKNIRIHTVGLGSGANISALRRISQYTKGESYVAKTSDELEDLYERIYRTDDFDKTDSDGDGLYDIIETAGMRLLNGDIIYTKPWDEDSDDDGLLDGQEIDPTAIYYEKGMYVEGTFVQKEGYYFTMVSDPNKEDSDDDGLHDGESLYVGREKVAPKDPQPLKENGPKGLWSYHYAQELSGARDARRLADWILPEDTTLLAAGGSFFLNFRYDENKIALHAQPDTWQKVFGYNDVYDKVFFTFTRQNVDFEKFEFSSGDIEYVIWTWRGDYLNLGSGAEIGLYYKPDSLGVTDIVHWQSVNFVVPMTLNLYNYYTNTRINNVFCWTPSAGQWWITGFNPMFKNPNVADMVSIGSIDFRSNREMYNDLEKAVQVDPRLGRYMFFDEDGHTVWLIWGDKV